MKPWHFQSVDVCNPAPAQCPFDNCAEKRIDSAIQTLRTYKGKSEAAWQARLKALRVLVHVVGDIHQPLHAAENNDLGANSVTLNNRKCVDYQTGQPVDCKLHAYWDNNLVKSAMGKLTEKKFAIQLSKTQTATKDLNVASWIAESNAIAKTSVHTCDGFACQIGKNKVSLASGYDSASAGGEGAAREGGTAARGESR